MDTRPAMSWMSGVARRAPVLSLDEEASLARAASQGCQRAFDALIRAHLRLVLAIAHETRNHGLSLDELVGEGMLGLVEAARRFDPDRGVRLSAYAAWTIRSRMRIATMRYRRIVRMPATRNGRKLIGNIRRVQRDLAQRDGEQPGAEDVADALDVGRDDVEQIEASLSGSDVPLSSDPTEPGVAVASAWPTPESATYAAEQRRLSRRALDQLSERERWIVQTRHLVAEPRSLESIGRELDLSRERVRQIDAEAKRKMRAALG